MYGLDETQSGSDCGLLVRFCLTKMLAFVETQSGSVVGLLVGFYFKSADQNLIETQSGSVGGWWLACLLV